MDRREFLGSALGAAFGATGFPYVVNSQAPGKTDNLAADKHILNRDSIVSRLREVIKDLLDKLEKNTHLTVKFRPLDRKFGVVAQYNFQQPNRPVISLRNDWEDVDVAHELIHMKLELVEGYSVLAWRKKVPRDESVEKAFGLIRSYVDDIIVFQRLFQMGLKIDGEVIKHQFFDDICTRVPKYLKEGRSLRNDGMAHFDHFAGGRYGDLRRSAFLVHAELFAKSYGDKLSKEHNRSLKDFISTFRRFRRDQAVKADTVLGYFKEHNVLKIEDHRNILSKWAALENISSWVGVSTYVRRGGGFVLPFPSKQDTSERNSKG